MGKAKVDLPARFAELAANHPSFSVVLEDGKTWVCPYCAKPAVADFKSPDFQKHALEHVLKKCPTASSLEAVPLRLDQMQHIVHLYSIRQKLTTESSWRLSLGNGKWLCPYCLESTGIEMVSKEGAKRSPDELMHDIHNHLSRCLPCVQNPARWHTVDEIRAKMRERKEQEEFARKVAEKMKTDPVFQLSDRYGHWICPFCEKPLASVDFFSEFAREHNAPYQAALHMQGGQCKYKGTLDPGKSLKAMQEVATKFMEEGAAAKKDEATTAGDTQYLSALRDEVSELRSHIEKNKEFQENLQRARKAQQKMLPSKPTSVPGFEVEVYFQASEEVSGDFYDFIPLPEGKLGVVIGDVAGHGIDAGIVMGMTKKAFSLRAQAGQDPVATTMKVNDDIAPELGKTTFVTAVYGILDPADESFTFVRCGHTFPVLCQPKADNAYEVLSDGVVLGSQHGDLFEKKTQAVKLNLAPGQSITLFTDGISEAMTETGEEFGKERIIEAVKRHKEADALGVLEGLIGSVQMFTQGHKQADDQTIIVIHSSN